MHEKYGNENGKKPYAEIAKLLPKDAVLGGVNSTYRVTSDKLQALTQEAKNMLISFGMIPNDAGILKWLGISSKENVQATPINTIKITNKYVQEHYGE